MDLSTLFGSLQTTLGAKLPGIVGALGILVIGWLVAVIARAGTRRLLALLKVNARIEESTGQAVHVEWGIAVGVFWMIILITLVAVFDSLQLTSPPTRSRNSSAKSSDICRHSLAARSSRCLSGSSRP